MKYKHSEAEISVQQAESKKIDWNDYNFPICINLFHYDSDQTPEALRKRVRLLRASQLLIIFTTLWNLANNIVNLVAGDSLVANGGIRVGLSVFLVLIWFPLSLYLFIIPYRIYMEEQDKAVLFYLLSLLAVCFFSLWSVADFADANGWIRMGKDVTYGKSLPAFFSFISSLLSMVDAILAVINVFYFCKRDTPAHE